MLHPITYDSHRSPLHLLRLGRVLSNRDLSAVADAIQPRVFLSPHLLEDRDVCLVRECEGDVIQAVDQTVPPEWLNIEWNGLAVLATNDLFFEIDFGFRTVARLGCDCVDLFLGEDDGQHAVFEAVL